MLKHILGAHGGKLPPDVYVTYFNTGREMPQTLDFVQECGLRWNVPIIWLEYDETAEGHTKVVSHNSASRNGEPFKTLIDKRGYLPNPVTRFCTNELKIRRGTVFMRDVKGFKHWTNIIGLRADEPHRVSKTRARNTLGKERFETELPLADAGVSRRDVARWWSEQPFDLHLLNVNGVTPHGNCDLCFLKSASTISGLLATHPELANWWIEAEAEAEARASKPSGAKFRTDRPSYAALLDAVQRQESFNFGDADALGDCFCTD